jgi:hypothetical protein
MNEVDRLRLRRMTERWARRRLELGEAPAELERERAAAFDRELVRVRDEVLRPTLAAIADELRRAGHDLRVEASDAPPRLDVLVRVEGRSGSEDRIQLEVREDRVRGREVVAEIVLKRSPVELRRFAWPGEISSEVAERLFVDALEHLFASPPR